MSELVAAALCLSELARAGAREAEARGARAAERLEEASERGDWSAAARAFGGVRAAARALSHCMKSDPLGERLLRVWENARAVQVLAGLARLPKLRARLEARLFKTSSFQEELFFELGWGYFCRTVGKELICGALLQREQRRARGWRRARRATRERFQRGRLKDRWREAAAQRKNSRLLRREILLELETAVT